MKPLDPPVDDMNPLWSREEAETVGEQLAQSHVGSPATVRPQHDDLLGRTRAPELVSMSETYDQAARARSYQLLASLWNR
ncbi:hypothetical protein [Streptomyces acidicola]|uniref:hypothetical protein n=1 Tax=Streptomyces acidicola TaxID=2596892 RepID=UPI00342CC0D7